MTRGEKPASAPFTRKDTTANLVGRLTSNRLDLLLLATPCDCGGADTLAVVRDPFVVAPPWISRGLTQERFAFGCRVRVRSRSWIGGAP
jgi:hypothetical protein